MAVPIIYLDFEIRKDYIAKVLCINKEKPIAMCGGHCVLSKKLQENQATQSNQKDGFEFSFAFNLDIPKPHAKNQELDFFFNAFDFSTFQYSRWKDIVLSNNPNPPQKG